MRIQAHTSPSSTKTTVITLVRDKDQFEAVIAPAAPKVQATHELRYLWNDRPFIGQVFQRGTLEALLGSVHGLVDELISRGWRLATNGGEMFGPRRIGVQ